MGKIYNKNIKQFVLDTSTCPGRSLYKATLGLHVSHYPCYVFWPSLFSSWHVQFMTIAYS